MTAYPIDVKAFKYTHLGGIDKLTKLRDPLYIVFHVRYRYYAPKIHEE